MALFFLLPVSATEFLAGLAAFCISYMLVHAFRNKIPKGLKQPPGPRSYPLVGNVFDLGKDPHLTLTKMSETYGDVLQIQIGTRPVVVLSGLNTLKQALIKKGDDFIGRPALYSFQFISNGNSLTFNTDLGDVWSARKKLAQSALRIFSTDESKDTTYSSVLEEHVSKEAKYLVTKLMDIMKTNGSFEPFRYTVVSVANVICALCFGKRYSHDDQELLSCVNMSKEFGTVAASGNPADFIPILRFLPNRTLRRFIDLNNRFNAFIQKIVQQHYKTFDKDNIRDITDSLINHCQDKKMDENANIHMSDEKIVTIVNDLFGAGFDTITTALCWNFMYLASYPDIQKKIHKELDEVIGRERRPRFSDRSVLPYTDAFIYETFRHSSFLPFTIPHCTVRDTAVNGYFIPKNTCIFINQWQVNHDPKLWEDPSAFCPERFLNKDQISLCKTETEKIMTFGMGKRRCIGESIGRSQVFLFLIVLLQHLEFYAAPGQVLDMTPEYGLTMKYKRCDLQVRMRFPTEESA
ncbi:cytochrome P450 1A1 [Latimeria chalumnae]|uniref:Cytochrome P450 1A n=1 Tax=Latimeria chalumnae TaxID=7897 RepID=H3B1Z3_LATCH|nr:PREDICTED: cytochrome P450 1A1 [Latimeria chalumnae]|eukprot:XP_005994149.1 PREDICTED: cytochrome P450 1A1 [Latimeria chalumnae]